MMWLRHDVVLFALWCLCVVALFCFFVLFYVVVLFVLCFVVVFFVCCWLCVCVLFLFFVVSPNRHGVAMPRSGIAMGIAMLWLDQGLYSHGVARSRLV